jgi:hypothetical protein
LINTGGHVYIRVILTPADDFRSTPISGQFQNRSAGRNVPEGDFTERAGFLRQIRPICQLLSNSSRAMSGFAPA